MKDQIKEKIAQADSIFLTCKSKLAQISSRQNGILKDFLHRSDEKKIKEIENQIGKL